MNIAHKICEMQLSGVAYAHFHEHQNSLGEKSENMHTSRKTSMVYLKRIAFLCWIQKLTPYAVKRCVSEVRGNFVFFSVFFRQNIFSCKEASKNETKPCENDTKQQAVLAKLITRRILGSSIVKKDLANFWSRQSEKNHASHRKNVRLSPLGHRVSIPNTFFRESAPHTESEKHCFELTPFLDFSHFMFFLKFGENQI